MEREIDIDNEKQILKECDFDYLYNSKKCSRELCMFYNDIILSANKMQGEYDVNRAFIDLGRIAIVLNKQSARIKELEEALKNANTNNYLSDYYLVERENQQLKQQLKEKDKVIEMQKSINRYDIGEMLIENVKLKQSQNEKENEILKKVVDFINELAWHDVKYDAFQSTMGEFPASPSAIPRYAKKYFDLWKEMFNENLEDKIKNWEQNNGRIYKK